MLNTTQDKCIEDNNSFSCPLNAQKKFINGTPKCLCVQNAQAIYDNNNNLTKCNLCPANSSLTTDNICKCTSPPFTMNTNSN